METGTSAHLPSGRSTAGRRRARHNHDPISYREADERWRQTLSGILEEGGRGYREGRKPSETGRPYRFLLRAVFMLSESGTPGTTLRSASGSYPIAVSI
jgi:hypothetical protein